MRGFRLPKQVVGVLGNAAGAALKVGGGAISAVAKVGGVVLSPGVLVGTVAAVAVAHVALNRARRNPTTGNTVLRELGELGGPLVPDLGEHLVEVYFLAKAETGLVDPNIAEIKVAERRVDRIMREYEDFVFTAEDRAIYQTKLAMLVVLPSGDTDHAMYLLQKRGITAPLERSAKYHAGNGWGRRVTLLDLITRQCSLRDYAQRGQFVPSKK